MQAHASPVRFTPKLSWYFDSGARKRGDRYFESGYARIVEGSASYVEVAVRGGNPYLVTLEVHDSLVVCFCDCPVVALCKHIWAALLESESQGYLADAVTARKAVFDYEDDLDEEDEEDADSLLRAPVPAQPAPWRAQLTGLRGYSDGYQKTAIWPESRQILYVFELTRGMVQPLSLTLRTRDAKKTGGWTKPKDLRITRADIPTIPDAADRTILGLLAGSRPNPYTSSFSSPEVLCPNIELHEPLTDTILPMLFTTGRVYAREERYSDREPVPIVADNSGPWRFELSMKASAVGEWVLDGLLVRSGEARPLSEARLLSTDGTLLVDDRMGRLENRSALRWMRHLRNSGPVKAPAQDGDAMLGFVLAESNGVPVSVPDTLAYERVACRPQPCLRIRFGQRTGLGSGDRLSAALEFRYGDRTLSGSEGTCVYDGHARRLFVRDAEVERQAVAELVALDLKYEAAGTTWWMKPARLPAVVTALLESGWHVDVDGKAFRGATGAHMEVTSGIDWFDLGGEVRYGDTVAVMPALLEALRRGEAVVPLADGSYGVVPPEWLTRFGRIAQLGSASDRGIRFSRAQTGLLDALLATDDSITFDGGFAHARRQLQSFNGIAPGEQPDTFSGTLREYQREGLGWMEFLRGFNWSGCLADDMGLGKTAQVLALLERRRLLRTGDVVNGDERPCGPSLVVVPKSLVFNWKAEAARFTPALRILEYTGAGRSRDRLDDHDVVLTTYGTLRRDVPLLREFEFDYVVLDEAQAIKNASTDSAKAVRLLRGRHRLAVSGTPIENHLGELWSLFEFLNPGMLGSANAFGAAGSARRDLDEEGRKMLARALRPFILRRTKQQVASELPERSEQTLWCELDTSARKLYDELRAHYRNSLLKRIDTSGLSKSKMHVLEALLRLRQAACHPGLLDPGRRSSPSAKLEILLEQLTELIEEGHKALVFSQFTTLLDLVRQRLDEARIRYEYLDGSTQDRKSPVERFQNDPACPVFLISLKAGGLGLNLTAAEYVFLLDPWWNPAVEAQAIDRAHRIGQVRPVFAYRLIARDTVEEKVIELQRSKRELAAAIIAEDSSLVRDLKREDLELLLS